MRKPSRIEVINLLSKINPCESSSNESSNNIQMIKDVFKCREVNELIDEGTLLHFFVDNLYPEASCYNMLEVLLNTNVDPNTPITSIHNDNFVQLAIRTGYTKKFIMDIIILGLKYGLDINYQNAEGQTIMHLIVGNDDYELDINFYNFLRRNGFDSKKFDRDFGEISLAKRGGENKPKTNSHGIKVLENDELINGEIDELQRYGTILNNKKYLASPAIGRDKELKNLIIALAQDKKMPIIVGESGVGKTAIVDELAYRIQNDDVPRFLKNKIILEVDPGNVVAGCNCVGDFEESMNGLIEVCTRYDVILFIDEIHTIYGVGTSKDKNSDMSAMLKRAIDRSGLRVIGATTEDEYYEYFAHDALKRRFEKIKVLEPTGVVLFQIVDKVLHDQSVANKIPFEDENLRGPIAEIIINATAYKNRVYNDRVNNPDLAISIIDKAFAFAKVEDSSEITVEHFIESFEICARIYDTAINEAIKQLRKLSQKEVVKGKVLAIKFN